MGCQPLTAPSNKYLPHRFKPIVFSNVEGGLPARRPPQESGFNMIWPHQEVVQIPKLDKISENELCAESIFKCI